MKRCSRCGESKSFSAFNKNKRQKDGHDIWCYACKTDNRLQKTYGISSLDYEEMFAAQGGVCRICGGPPKRKRLDIDHCHNTGRVRALLCEHCNRGLGCFKDNPILMTTAISYLHEHSSIPDARSANVSERRRKKNVEGADSGA